MTKRDFRIAGRRLHPELNVEIISGLPTADETPSLFNISRGGMFLEGAANALEGSNVQLALNFGERDRIVATTDVKWVRPSSNGPFQPQGLGVQFTRLEPKDRTLLESYLEEGAIHLTISDIMAVGDFSISPNMRVKELAELRREKYFPAAVVREGSAAPLGLVPAEWLFSFPLSAKIGDMPVTEVMVPASFISPEITGTDLVRGMFAARDMNYIVSGATEQELYGLITHDMIEGLWPVLLRSFLREGTSPIEQSMFRLVHDLRTPLTAIQSTHGLLSEGTVDLKTYLHSGFATAVEANCSRLLELTEEILHLASGKAPTQTLTQNPVPVGALISEIIERLTPLAKRRSMTIVARVSPTLLWPTAPKTLTRLLENLLGNSLRNAASGAQIVIEAESDNQTLQIVVSDQGTGVPEEVVRSMIRALEEPQADRAHEQALRDGHGFGLTIVRQLLGILGGKAAVTANAKGGITVKLHFYRPSMISTI